MIAANVPVAVVSSTVLPAKVAAAIADDAACATEGRLMLVRVNIVAVPAFSVPEVNATVNTLDVKVAVAAGVPPMPMKAVTCIVAVDVNPMRVTTTWLKLATLVGIKVTITAAGVVPATAVENVMANECKLAWAAGAAETWPAKVVAGAAGKVVGRSAAVSACDENEGCSVEAGSCVISANAAPKQNSSAINSDGFNIVEIQGFCNAPN